MDEWIINCIIEENKRLVNIVLVIPLNKVYNYVEKKNFKAINFYYLVMND